MKFTINKDEFVKSLLNITKIIQPKNINPILTNVKLVLDNVGLNLTGSNGDLSITQNIPLFKGDREIIRDVKPGGCLINAKILSDIARKIDGTELYFELIDNSVAKISNGKSIFKLNTVNVEEYTDIDFSKNGTIVKFTKDKFINSINEVAFAVAVKETRPILTAINFYGENNSLTMTATDGARLATKNLSIDIENKFNANIPSKTLLEALKSITDEEFINLYISDKKVLIELKNCLIISRLTSGDYPSIKNLIPKNYFYILDVNASEFLGAIERVSLISQENESVVKLIMTENSVEISSKSQAMGSAVEKLNVFKYEGERLEISFRANFVTSAIRALKSEDVTLSFVGEMKPFVVTNKNDPNLVQVITPVRTY